MATHIDQDISDLPEVAGRFDTDFIKTADDFLNALPDFCDELNTYADQANDLADDVNDLHDETKAFRDSTQNIKDSALDEIDSKKNSALDEIDSRKNSALDKIDSRKNSALDEMDDVKDEAVDAKDIAVASANWEGEWDSSKNYDHPVSIVYNDIIYASLDSNENKNPETETDYWYPISNILDKNSYKFIINKDDSNDGDELKVGYTYYCDTTNNAFTLKLPTNSKKSERIRVIDKAYTFFTNNLTIDRNSKLINGQEEDYILDIDGDDILLTCIDSDGNWRIKL